MRSQAVATKKKIPDGKNWVAEIIRRVDKQYLQEMLDIFLEYPEILVEVKKRL